MLNPLDKTSAVILAAGQGTRMKSGLPKVLHALAGKPLIYYPVRAALEAGCAEVVVVVGHGREAVERYLAEAFGDVPSVPVAWRGRVKTAVQHEQLGTGDAARAGLVAVQPDAESVLIFYGDVPLLRSEDLAAVGAALHNKTPCMAIATCSTDNPFGYGRILRNAQGKIVEIREQKDLRSDEERAIREWNPGVYVVRKSFLISALESLKPTNAQCEYYLTDIVGFAGVRHQDIASVSLPAAVMDGINDRVQLARAERVMLDRLADMHRKNGVTIREGARIEEGVVLEQDVVVESFAVLRGSTRVGRHSVVDVGCVLTNVEVGEGVSLKPYSVLTNSVVHAQAQIGPFSHIRPDSEVGEYAHVGNFVELKKTKLERGAKANHLSYLGDGFVGENANIGAGTIFCNYDGVQKHTTRIGRDAFIGSDSQLVAPVTIGDGAYVGTGTTVTRDVPSGALAIGRAKQENKDGYASRLRARFKAQKESIASSKK